MTPEMTFFAVRALIRMGHAGRDLMDARRRNQPFSLPPVPPRALSILKNIDPFTEAWADLKRIEHPGFLELAAQFPQLTDPLGARSGEPIPANVRIFILEMAEAEWHKDLAGADALRPAAREIIGRHVIKPWTDTQAVTHGFLRLGLEMADIGLEFAGTNPALFSTSANGERLIKAVSLSLQDVLPAPDQLDNASEAWMEHAAAMFFKAGLGALHRHAETAIEEDHLQELALGILTPFRDLVDETASVGRMPRLHMMRDLLLGPVTEAAVSSLARNRTEFLGTAGNQPIGAITKAVLETAMDTDVLSVFSKDGLIRTFSSALSAVAERPAIFISGDGPKSDFLRDILSRTSGLLSADGNPFDADFGPDLIAVALESVAAHAPRKFGDDPWGLVAGDLVESVLTGFASSLAETRSIGIDDLLSRDRALALSRTLFQTVARTPGMLVGDGARQEVKEIAAGIATILSDQNANLLSVSDWDLLVASLVEEAARNPGVLFTAASTSSGQGRADVRLGVTLVSDMLRVAADGYRSTEGRKRGLVLFGDTLREACALTLRAAAGNARSALSDDTRGREAPIELARALTRAAQRNPGRIGGREWLHIYRMWVAHVIDTGQVPTWQDTDVLLMLEGDKQPAFSVST